VNDPGRLLAKEIVGAADRAASLTRQLLAFSRRQVLDIRVIDLNEVVRSICRMLERLLGEDVRLVTRLDPKLPLVRADIGQMEQVVMNLCTNARDAMPKGGDLTIVTDSVTFTPEQAEHGSPSAGRWVRLSAVDAGVGMSAEVASRAFEPFFTTKTHGTGLGLATVHGVVTQSGGRVSIESQPGRGTTITIWLPAHDEDELRSAPMTAELNAPIGKETVLVVEDDEGVRTLTERVLARQGYEVLVASPADLERVLTERPGRAIDLLVSDVVMPTNSGERVAELVRRAHPHVKVLFVSGYSQETVSLRVEGSAFLPKPFTPSLLARTVREVLDAATRTES
jgi:CheY-like chemotaxis protein